MAGNKQTSRSSGSRASSSRPSGGRYSASRNPGRSVNAGSRSSARSGSAASRSSSYNKSSSRNSVRSSNRRTQSNSSAKSGISAFYKAMVLLAVCGIIAALYAGGHLSNLTSVIADFSASGITDESTNNSSVSSTEEPKNTSSTTTASSATVTTTTASTTTEKSKTTSSTTTTTTKTKKTTTTTVADSGKNAKYVKSPNYESPYYIVVFTGSQSVVVYSKDSDGNYTDQTKVFKCSTGASGTPTRTGMYSILRSYRWRQLLGGVYGQYCSGISSSYLFHSVLYDKKDNSTLFENSYKNLGSAASHGCIRLSVRDAKWIYDNCPHGTQVNIVNADGPKGAELPALKSGSEYRGWEPTDPDKNNPYNKKEDTSSDTKQTSSTADSEDTGTTTSTESTTPETTLPPPVVG